MKKYDELSKCSTYTIDQKKVEKYIFNILKNIAIDIVKGTSIKFGSIIVLGNLLKSYQNTNGFIQMKPKKNPIKSVVMIDTEDGANIIKTFSKPPYDGAIIVDKNGQILSVGMYLVIDRPDLSIPDECGTRHKAAASFSLRNDVISVLTLSEETNTIRIWKDGISKKTLKINK